MLVVRDPGLEWREKMFVGGELERPPRALTGHLLRTALPDPRPFLVENSTISLSFPITNLKLSLPIRFAFCNHHTP
jgi:hypothetical protein